MRRGSLILNVVTGTASYLVSSAMTEIIFKQNRIFSAGFRYYPTTEYPFDLKFPGFNYPADAKATIESGRRSRNLSFGENNFEVSAVGVVDLYPVTARALSTPPNF